MRGVPALSPRGLALFRIALGVSIALYLASDAYEASAPTDRGIAFDLTDVALVHWLAAHAGLVNAIRLGAAATALVFAAGFAPRLTYAVMAAGTIVWMWVVTVAVGAHPYSVLLVALLALFAAKWPAAPPLHRLSREPGAPRFELGYAPWVLSLSLAVAFAAAAYAKLRDGPEWIAGGNAKFAWVSDGRDAKVDWGLRLAAQPRTAVALSATAVAVEALVIVSAFTRSTSLRLALGVSAASLLAGFDLLQGVFWPAWWIALLGFLPWDCLSRRPAPSAAPAIPRWQAGWGAALIAQQVVVSAAFTEVNPIASRYDMYSTVHRITDGVGNQRTQRIVAVTADGASLDITSCARDEPSSVERLRDCSDRDDVTEFLQLEDHEVFDWTAGRFVWDYKDRLIGRIRP
jgi:hypothetical protein